MTNRSGTSNGAVFATLWVLVSLSGVGLSVEWRGSSRSPGLEPIRADSGTPISSDAVVQNCVSCHAQDSTGRMTRISYMRKTPEGWQASVRRMVMLNGVQLEPEDAREIVRYLSNNLGLAPEELRPARFEVERRMIDYVYEPDEDTETTCKQCHSLGRVVTQRRTGEEWGLLVATHRGYYPLSDFQAFRRGGPPPPDEDDPRQPMDKAIAHLSREFPLDTPEWTAWSATMRPARLAGAWGIAGHAAGRGPVYGRMTITGNPDAPDEFTTEIDIGYAEGGSRVSRRGRALVYTGYQWRGRSFEGSGDDGAMREVMMVERDWREMSGRWFAGAYDEIGMDVTLRRIERSPLVLGVHPTSVRAGSSGQELHIYGANLPADLAIGDVDFGRGVEVTSVTVTSDIATVRVDVSADASIGERDLFVAGVGHTGAVVVFDEVDRIRVTPQAGMARVGGGNFPKQYQQFEAFAYSDGQDDEPNTADDLNLGRADVTWSLEEYTATYDDEDLRFVGSLDDRGMFTPALDGPNPDRSGSRNNIGDVWVVATYDVGGVALRARAHLLVTVPLYMRWEPWRVER